MNIVHVKVSDTHDYSSTPNTGMVCLPLQLTELVKFLLVLAVFIISFGVAFQAILHPNQTPSWSTLIDIVWRPYWQMFGELFLDDVSVGMGSYSTSA